MAKIKFNLNFGGQQIRTLDELRENFSIEDVVAAYENIPLIQEGRRENLIALFGSISDETFCRQPELSYALDMERKAL